METEGSFMAELIDIRTKVDLDINAVLDAHAIAHDCDKAEIARRWLTERAKKELHVATIVARVTQTKGGNRS